MGKERKLLLTPGRLAWRRLLSNRIALAMLAILVVFALLSFAAPLIAPYDRDGIEMTNIERAPSADHWLGTDELGRDVYTRLLYGGRVSLGVGICATLVQLVIGITLGAIAGFYGGRTDSLIMRFTDIVMCFPFFALAISLAAILGPSVWNVILIIGVLEWTGVARLVRGQILSLRSREFIEAARALGLSSREIILKHLLPNTMAPVVVYATLGVATGILSEAGLSFLGLGVKQPQPSWGSMLAAAQKMRILQTEWWLWVPAGLLVFLTVLAINFLGDGLRDALEPDSRN